MLQALYLNINEMTGQLPDSWSTLTDLSTLFLRQNSLTGQLPASWSALVSLRSLSAGSNALSGSIPPEWDDALDELNFLDLEGNPAMCGAVSEVCVHVRMRVMLLLCLVTSCTFRSKCGK